MSFWKSFGKWFIKVAPKTAVIVAQGMIEHDTKGEIGIRVGSVIVDSIKERKDTP